MKEKGKISNTKKQHNKGSKYGKKKDKKMGGKDSRAKSYEIYKNIRYQIKGVELFLRKNKKNKKKMKSKNDVSGNTVNKKIINNQKDNLDKKTYEDIKLESNIQIKLNKEKEKILEDEDDIIFNDILNLDDNENNNKNNQKIKFYQRPNDKILFLIINYLACLKILFIFFFRIIQRFCIIIIIIIFIFIIIIII